PGCRQRPGSRSHARPRRSRPARRRPLRHRRRPHRPRHADARPPGRLTPLPIHPADPTTLDLLEHADSPGYPQLTHCFHRTPTNRGNTMSDTTPDATATTTGMPGDTSTAEHPTVASTMTNAHAGAVTPADPTMVAIT